MDIVPQPRYPMEFVRAEAIQFALTYGHRFDFIHASPPCQLYSKTQRIRQNVHPDLLGPTRDALNVIGVPWVIENVMGAEPEMRSPVLLCGEHFGLHTYRHRLFEAGGWELPQPDHPVHTKRQTKMGRRRLPGEMGIYVGNFIGVDGAKEDLGVPWMSREGIRECIPPAYTEYVGREFIKQLG
ncbi:SAM-dependent methyltransferase [Streptomyces sp. NRRL S-241]|uniref:SAM-dependent methyltransferase n=1 Tax=Streptomyces sp. NRRL S-241 TaxID=1463896 RepID=UPI002D218BF8|nr:SAM-dependent methyltransferase [Streptomyces sp. NRRL S-241]